jgi:hypothetical protein
MVYEIRIFIKLSVIIPFPISDDDKNKLTNVYEYRFHSDRITYEVFDILKEKMKIELGLDTNMYHYIIYSNPNIDININSTQTLHAELKNRLRHNGNVPLILVVDNITPLLQHLNISRLEEPEVCPVCLNSSIQFIQPYICSHQICVNCHEECISHSLLNCSLCRSGSRPIIQNIINPIIHPNYNNIMR